MGAVCSDTRGADPGRGSLWLFGGAIFAAAFLIFLVQPIVGKRILPWFGGVPAVWTLCLAFYQTTVRAARLCRAITRRTSWRGSRLPRH